MTSPDSDVPEGAALLELTAVMERLRRECAWKASQTHRSLERYLLEEAHEVLEAIEMGSRSGDWEHLREELGDLLLQVWFHAAIAAESRRFDIDDIAGDLIAKLIRRNPHVFGEPSPGSGSGSGEQDTTPALDPRSVNELWESIKAEEKQRTSVLDGLPPTLPALLLADKVLERRERAGLPSVPDQVMPDPEADIDLLDPIASEYGVRLLSLVAEARAAGVDPEQALRDVVRAMNHTDPGERNPVPKPSRKNA